jgi:hypothetical protein
MRLALSSNGSTRPANNACGPSGPENQRSNSLRFFPAGFSRIPRRIPATVIEEINRSSSACSAIHATRFSDGAGLVTWLMILVSSRLLLTGQPLRPAVTGRLRSKLAPTRGERRNALRIPPFFGGSPEMAPRTVARIRAESGPSPASRFASDRIKPRSPVQSQNLEPGHPSLVEALPVVFQRSLLRSGPHGEFLSVYPVI